MAERTDGVRAVLGRADLYSLVQRAMGVDGVHRHFVAHGARVQAGDRVLDLGCGPGTLLRALPPVTLVGLDISPEYVAAARERYGSPQRRFEVADVADAATWPDGPFDAVICSGLLHHLDDDQVRRVLGAAAARLGDGGRFAAVENAWADGQHPVSRWLIARDRGQDVRRPEALRAMAEPFFTDVDVAVHHDLARVPYTHAILIASGPR